jgi:signal transduction histidine kinase
MAIGTILLGSERMYFVAAGTSLSAVVLHLVESRAAAREGPELMAAVSLLALVAFLFGTVYLTASVSDRLKQQNYALRRTTAALRQRSAELQRLLAELEDLERRKSHYMRVSAHQLRSPLGTVRTSLDVLAEGYVDLSSDRGRRLLRGVAERVDGLLLLVNGLLDLAKVREGRQRAPWARQVNLNQLIADLFDSLAPYAEERGVRLTADVQAVAVLDWGVPPDLVHALENLIHNAIKYSRPGGEVVVRLATSGELAIVRVEDRGIGVPEGFREHLFLEFMRAPNARSHAVEGTGLGLAVVREVATGHGGHVCLERSGPGETVFRLELPLHGSPPAGAAAIDAAIALPVTRA